MGKIMGVFLVFCGVAGILYTWMMQQKERQMRLEEMLLFLQKSVFAMEKEKVKVIDYFANYISDESKIEKLLHEISKRLAMNIYPNGIVVWEEVFKEEEQNLMFDKATFEILLRTGNGFFGRSRVENICFLQKSIQELEEMQEKMKEKDMQERKVWIPVGMLGTLMTLILFI